MPEMGQTTKFRMEIPAAGFRPGKQIIAVDCDEVLCFYLKACNLWYNKQNGTSFQLEDYQTYEFNDVWGITQVQCGEQLLVYHQSDHFLNAEPVPGAREALIRLREHYDLVLVTSRQWYLQDITVKWLEMHFGKELFAQYMFGNHWSIIPGEPSFSKLDLCKRVGAIALIDDLPRYAIDVSRGGITPVIFDHNGTNGWSKMTPEQAAGMPALRRFTTWEEVVDSLINDPIVPPFVLVDSPKEIVLPLSAPRVIEIPQEES